MIAVKDDLVFVGHRVAAKSVCADKSAWANEPFPIALEVVSSNDHLSWTNQTLATDVRRDDLFVASLQKTDVN